MSTCKSCGTHIMWLVTEAGKRIPVDEDPVDDGNIAMGDNLTAVFASDPHSRYDPHVGPMYVSHFRTCPQAKDWRAK